MATAYPKAEIEITPALVQKLISTQFPEFSTLNISFFNEGFDNENYRLGEKYMVRLPRRKVAVELLSNEINWLPQLQGLLPIPISAPVKVGKPTENFPWVWAIIPWYEGEIVGAATLAEAEAVRMADFLKILHAQNYENAPINPHRGIPLIQKNDLVLSYFEKLKITTNFIPSEIEFLWQQAVNEPYPATLSLLHGDLHPCNVIAHEQKISAIIDWGDLTKGDVANDLACFWMLFGDKIARQNALQRYGADESLIKRSMGWAVFFAVIFLGIAEEVSPIYKESGAFMIKNLLEDYK